MNLYSNILSLLALAFALWVFYGPWQWVCTDVARQKLFEKRDAIFDMARSGQLDFNSSEYRQIRSALEKAIRFAHELTLTRIVYVELVWPIEDSPITTSDLRSAIGAIESLETRKTVSKIIDDADEAMTAAVVSKSLVCLAIIAVLLPFLFVGVICYVAVGGVRETKTRTLSKLSRWVGDIAQRDAERFA